MDYSTEIKGYTLEYYDDEHLYLVDGQILPSITEILSCKFGHKYDGVSASTLKRASEKGTAVHDAIERWCVSGEESDLPEVRNFRFLQRQYKFEVIQNEVPVILFDREPIACGRLDLVLRMDGKIGGADIKRTSVLDKMYLFYQLNLYRIAYFQSYGVEWEFLKGIHLREEKRRFVDIPINLPEAWMLVEEWRNK